MSSQRQSSMAYNVSLLGAGHFFSDFYANFLPALLPLIMTKLGLSLTVSGMLVMTYSVISSVLQPLSGYVIDKYGYSWLILVTTPVSAGFICLAGLADNIVSLFLLVGLAGLGASIFHPLAASLMARVVTAESTGTAMAVFVCTGNAGFALAPAVVMYLLNLGGPSVLLWLMIPGLLVTAASYLAGLHKVTINPQAQPDKSNSNTAGAEPWYKSRGLLLLNAASALRFWLQVALTTFIPVALAAAGYQPSIAAGMLTVFLLGGAAGSLIGGWLGDKIGRKAGVVGSLLVSLPVTYLFLDQLAPTPVNYVLLAVSGALLQGTVPTMVVWAQELIPGNAAMASGMMLGLSFGLGGVGAAVTGALGDRVGLEAAMMWSLLSLVGAIFLALAIPKPGPARLDTVKQAGR